MSSKKAIVIGSGIGGIATAIRLKKLQYDVSVYEASNTYGGKLGEIQSEGFRWDSGPSLFTMPHFYQELFALFGKDMSEYIPFKKMDVISNYFWDDGTTFSMRSDLERSYQELARLFHEPFESIKAYFEKSLKKYELTAPIFLESSLHKSSSYFNLGVLKALLKSSSLDIHKSLHELNSSEFKNEKMVQLLDRFATYNGSSPYETPGIMSMIPSLEMHFGTYFPLNGMRSIADGLFNLAKEVGVKFHFNEKVEQMIMKARKVNSIKTSKGLVPTDLIICNSDIWFAYEKLIRPNSKVKSVHAERSSSALIFYWGIKKEFPQLDLHNIFFSSNYQEEFNSIFKDKSLYHDPTVYVNISSKERSSDAPTGMENWFVMINAPSNEGQNWEELKNQSRKNILNKLSSILGVPLETLVVTERVMDPIAIEEKTSSYKGALYGISSNDKRSAFLRHPNFSKEYKGLYFVGGSVHPGGGLPLCLKSAKITSKLIAER